MGQAYISLLVPKGTGPGVYTVTDLFGAETVPKLDLGPEIGPDWERLTVR